VGALSRKRRESGRHIKFDMRRGMRTWSCKRGLPAERGRWLSAGLPTQYRQSDQRANPYLALSRFAQGEAPMKPSAGTGSPSEAGATMFAAAADLPGDVP
jgi:hypothetical protein